MKLSKTEAKKELAKRELARRHFQPFCEYVYEGYIKSWHTQLLCEALEKVYEGKIRFLIIEMPPRHSKSLHVSQLFPAWFVGKDKDAPIIVSSYSGDLATDHGRETRNLIGTRKYKNIFNTRLAADSTAKGKWNTNGKGAYNAAGVGGSITGKGARVLVVDDPFKDRKEVDSEGIRDDRWKWLKSVARTRLTPNGGLVIMHTRWHEDDMIGRIIEEHEWVSYFDVDRETEKYVRLQLKAVAEEDEKFRKKGEALWPEQYPLKELDSIRRDIGPYEWSSLYQQEPVDDESREFKAEWIKSIPMERVEMLNTRKFVTIDPGGKDSNNDYTGIVRNYVSKENNWHFKAMRVHIDSAELIKYIFLLHDEGFEIIGTEETVFTKAIEPFFNEECRKRNKFPNVVPLKHSGRSKEMRIRGLIPRYSSGSVYHIEGECEDLEKEQRSFPKGTYDDTLDAAAYQNDVAIPPEGDTQEDFSIYSNQLYT